MNCSRFSCDLDPSVVIPPPNGTLPVEVTIHIGASQPPGIYLEEIGAAWNSALRIAEVDVEVLGDDLIFADGFESGDTSAWN